MAEQLNMTTTLSSPFDWVNEAAQARLLAVLTLAFIVTSWWLTTVGAILFTDAAPTGIVSFELAGNLERSRAILESWNAHAHANALLVQGFDSLYLIVYPVWFSLACVLLAKKLKGRWLQAGMLVSWLILIAAPFDAVENYALIEQLLDGPSSFYAQTAWWAAVPKFALVALATFYLLAGAVARGLTNRSGPQFSDQ